MSEANVISCELSQELPQKWYELVLPYLPSQEQEKIRRFKFQKDKDRSLLGKILLWKLLHEQSDFRKPLQFDYSEYQRPSIRSCHADFSISHSGEIVVCGLSTTGLIGVDVEEERPVAPAEFNAFFNPEELQWIGDSRSRFFQLWSRKEALIKASGSGMFADLLSINATQPNHQLGGREFVVQNLELQPDYGCAIALSENTAQINFSAITIDTLANFVTAHFAD